MIKGYNIVEKNGRPAKSRFTDPVALRAVYDQLTLDDAKDAERRAKIKRMYDGYLPYTPEQLRAAGIKHVTNVNWHGLKATVDNRAETVMGLEADTTNIISLLPLSRELAGPDAERISKVVAQEFSTILRETGKMIPVLAMMNKEADLYGLGPVTFLSPTDYTPVALERAQVRFVADGPLLSSDHELIMFETTMSASFMFFLLDNPEIAVATGWDLAAVKEWLVKAFYNDIESKAQPGTEGGTTYNESAISLIRQNRFEEEHQFKQLHVLHALVKEMAYPRGITHIIMPASEQKRFLFRMDNAYQTMDQCFLWFPYSVLEKKARAVRGIASDLYPIELTNNRYKCRIVDLAFQNASLLFSQSSVGAQQQLTLIEQGAFTVIPKELVPVQNNVKPDMNSVMAFSQFMDNMGINSVSGTDKAMLSQTGPKVTEGRSQQTKVETEIQQRIRTRKDEALRIKRLSVIDKILRESFRRFITLAVSGDEVMLADYPEVATFLQRCQFRGVTPEMLMAIPQMFLVITCRDLVLGSEGKVGALSEILGSFANLADEPGRKNMFRDIVQLRLGDQAADRYAAEISRDQAPSDQSSFATLENNSMRGGLQVQVGSDQLHWSHIPIHAQILQEIVEQVKAPQDNQGGQGDESIAEQTLQNVQDPRSTLQLLASCSKHIQEHLAIGGQQIGMQEQAQQVQKMLRDLRPTVKALNLAVATQERVEQAEREKQEREMQELQQRADQNELEKARYEVDKKAETDRYRVDKEHEVAMHKAELEAGRASAQDDRANQSFEADQARRDAESQARIDREQQMANAKINSANAVNRFNAVNEVTGQQSVSPEDLMQPDEDMLEYGSL